MTQPDDQAAADQRQPGDHERAMERLTMDYPITFDVPPAAAATSAEDDPAEN